MSLQVKNLNKLPTGNADSASGTVLSQLPEHTPHGGNVPRLQEAILTAGNHGLLGEGGSLQREDVQPATKL